MIYYVCILLEVDSALCKTGGDNEDIWLIVMMNEMCIIVGMILLIAIANWGNWCISYY